MKKIILASVALIAVFASCKKEDIRTVYKANPAEATITIKVFDALYGKDVTSQATVTADPSTSPITVTGNTVKLVGDQAHYNAIPAQKVTVKASYDGRDGSVTVPVEGVLEGGVASYSATVVVGHAIDPTKPVDYTIKNGGTELATGPKGYLAFATHSHDGSNWVINNSEFVLFGVTNYDEFSGIKGMDIDPMDSEGADLEYILKQSVELTNANPFVKTNKEYKYTVSAFSYFNVMVAYGYLTQFFDCYRVNILEDGSQLETLIGSIDLMTWVTSGPQYIEIASPDHASHYVAGHGVDDAHYSHEHGHGGSNAGGGIVIAD